MSYFSTRNRPTQRGYQPVNTSPGGTSDEGGGSDEGLYGLPAGDDDAGYLVHRRAGAFGDDERPGTVWDNRARAVPPRNAAGYQNERGLRSEQAEEALAQDEHLGGKTIGWMSSIILYINNIHGTGVLAIPIIYQQAGWVVPTLMLLLMSLVATFSGTLLCEAMSLIPGNDNFQRRVEFATCVKYYFSRRWYLTSQVLFNVCLQVQLVAGIIVSASVMDEFIVFLFGRSYALEYYPSLRLTALTSATEPYAGLGALVSVGFVVAFLLCLPMGMFNLEAQMGIQWVSFFFMLAIHGEFFWQFFSVPSWAYTQTPAVGGDFSRVLGVIIFSFAHVISLPSWACEKKPDVSVTTTVWVATWFNFALYLATGLFGAWAYPHMKTADFLVVLARPHSPLATKIGVILFSLTAILPGLPVHSTIVRYNLFVSGYSHAVSYFWSNLFPWVFALWVYHSHMFSLILNWGALLASGAVSFLIPLALFVKARAVTAGFVDRAQHYHGVPRALRCAPATSIALTCLVVTFATIVFAISWDLYLLFQGQNVVTGD